MVWRCCWLEGTSRVFLAGMSCAACPPLPSVSSTPSRLGFLSLALCRKSRLNADLESPWEPVDRPASGPADGSSDFFLWPAGFLLLRSPSISDEVLTGDSLETSLVEKEMRLSL